MSSEKEKLIEIWLDSAGERQYQFAFRNAVLFSGETVLHDTSHTSLELGKDLITRAASGEINAYQLKGNPGSRLTISQWHELIPQINALVYQPITLPGVKKRELHQPYLVTNGEIHEDVHAAIDAYNARLASAAPAVKPLKTIARGELLGMLLKAADVLWPVDISLQRDVLNIYALDGDDVVPLQLFCSMLFGILKMGGDDRYSAAAIPAAHLITSILSSRWIEKENYFEVLKLYTMLCVASACYAERWSKTRRKEHKYIDQILSDVRAILISFVRHLKKEYSRGLLLNSSIFSEFSYYHPRKKMISGVLSIAILWENLIDDEELYSYIWNFVCKTQHKEFLLSEGIVPFCLAEFYALAKVQGTNIHARGAITLLNNIISCNNSENEEENLPSPYYELQDVVLWRYRGLTENLVSAIDDDSHYRRAWFAEALFYLIARRNYKRSCQVLWPDLTRFLHCRSRLQQKWQFGLFNCDDAVAEDCLLATPKGWDDVVAECAEEYKPLCPDYLLDRPYLMLLFCLFVPYRMDKDVVLWLDRAFCKTWY
jgi:hypothetical protein